MSGTKRYVVVFSRHVEAIVEATSEEEAVQFARAGRTESECEEFECHDTTTMYEPEVKS